MNDAYDWEGPEDPIVCATEADTDGALTMQILTLLTETPVLFADVRHYNTEAGIFDLCNSGQHATYFAARSTDANENMPLVHFWPEVFYFPAGGASVQRLAAPGPGDLRPSDSQGRSLLDGDPAGRPRPLRRRARRALHARDHVGMAPCLRPLRRVARHIERVVAVGGGAASRLWLSIVSDVIGLTQVVPERTTGASYGDAFLAGLATRVVAVPSAIEAWVRPGETIQPDPRHSSIYDELYPRFRDLYVESRGTFHELARQEHAHRHDASPVA